ncbi:MAG: GH92 family glycosyl hydrolase, partial [Spirochaetales bacterium]|nr:GH92 family glycosyl hydrolase [Spirochaetales bacterium]
SQLKYFRVSPGSVAEYGGMIPGVTPPFGMQQWTPMTRLNYISSMPYEFSDSRIIGFIATRQPAIWMGDYGQFSMMPGNGNVVHDFAKRGLSYSHEDEVFSPAEYRISLPAGSGRIKARLAASEHSGVLQFDYSDCNSPFIVVDASYGTSNFPNTSRQVFSGWIQIDPARREIRGYNSDRHSAHLGPALTNFKGWFVIRFDQPFESWGVYNGNNLSENSTETQGDICGAFIRFKASDSLRVTAAAGASLISLEQAASNLEAEIGTSSIDDVVSQSREKWNKYLSTFVVNDNDEVRKRIFYTGLYHTGLYPRIFSEQGRYYSAFDDSIHDGVAYNDYSLWDTFRAQHPLLVFTAPERVGDMITSLLQMYQQGGWLPKWPNPGYTGIMIGSHADSVIADAWVKGIRNFDINLAYEAVKKGATVAQKRDKFKKWVDRGQNGDYPETRGGLYWYMKLGYVPCNKTFESVSRTIEFSYGDFCVSVIADAAGFPEDAEYFFKRSKNYKNVYRKGFVTPRNSCGMWTPLAPFAFTEGSKWTYQFGPMHDILGLVDLLGADKYEQLLDQNFNEFHFRHDNEPGHHYPYLYNYSSSPWKTQDMVRKVMTELYSDQPVGYMGNEDCGQMSAWYVFSALGFYPVSPGTTMYAIGSPIFDEVVINLSNGKKLTIVALNNSEDNCYIQQLKLNGKDITTPFISHQQILEGGILEFVMGSEPSSGVFSSGR